MWKKRCCYVFVVVVLGMESKQIKHMFPLEVRVCTMSAGGQTHLSSTDWQLSLGLLMMPQLSLVLGGSLDLPARFYLTRVDNYIAPGDSFYVGLAFVDLILYRNTTTIWNISYI